MSKNIIDKIWDTHVVKKVKDFPDILYIDRMLMHEVTSAQAFDKIKELGISVNNPRSIIATVDHSISTSPVNRVEMKDAKAKAQVEKLRSNVKEFGVDFMILKVNIKGLFML